MLFERVEKLKFMAARGIFYILLNICYNFTYNSWFCCFFKKFYGCPLKNGEESYCFTCQIRTRYDIQEIEKIKKLSTIINVYDSLKKISKDALILNLILISSGVSIIKQLGDHMERLGKRI